MTFHTIWNGKLRFRRAFILLTYVSITNQLIHIHNSVCMHVGIYECWMCTCIHAYMYMYVRKLEWNEYKFPPVPSYE